MDISSFSLAELKELLERIPAEIKRREKQERAETLKALEALAAERGFKLDELVGTPGIQKTSRTVAVKYRHPDHAELAWTGRGRQPRWVAEHLEAGGTLNDLAV